MLGCLRHPSVDRVSLAAASLWSVGVALALAATLSSLRSSGYDGLNNMFQIPLALPWLFIPIGGSGSHEADAWIAAAMGWLNAVLILLFLPEYRRRRALPPPPSY